MGYERRDPAASAVHRPLLHRRLSDAADRPRPRATSARRGNCRCSRSELIALSSSRMMSQAASPTASRSSPAPRAASAHATALALAKAGAHVVAVARTVGGLEELDDAIKAAGGTRDARAARPQGLRRHRPARRRAQRALRQARRPGRQCRHSRRALAARPCRAEGLGRRDRGQRHRQLAPDPLAWIRCCRNPMPAARCSSPRARRGRRAPIGAPTRSPRPRSN